MKKITFILFINCIACGFNNGKPDYSDFPTSITLKKLQEEYKIASIAMYSINSCCECNCMAQNLSKPGSNANILELDLKLESFIEKKDTTIFYFNFYRSSSNGDTMMYQTHSENYSSCMYNGIAVLSKSRRYFPTALGDHEAIDIDKNFIDDSKKEFNKCLLLSDIKISETLKKILK